ncbi:MAG TPA: DUF1772 domain-containing protein [Chitinophagaceae bacterium]|nr:DUF1772 domain-containing protein [Chitinophagaceae bacterium]
MKGLLLTTALCTALMAGLFFAYSFSVVPGLGQLGDYEYLRAMQSINRAIQNPFFFIPFFTAVLLLPLSAYRMKDRTRKRLLQAAAACYTIGVMLVTIIGNVPLNNAIEAMELHNMSVLELKAQRFAFEPLWNRLNMVRTVCSSLAFVFVAWACLHKVNPADG